MRVFDRYLLDAAAVDFPGKLKVTAWISLEVILVVEMARITAAHVHDPDHRFVQAIEAAFQRFDAIGERCVDLAYEQRFVDLNVAAAGLGERANFIVQRGGQIEGQPALIFIEFIRRRIHDRKRAGNRDLDRVLAAGLGDAVIAVEKVIAAWRDLAIDGRQVGNRGAVAVNLARQAGEVNPYQVTAVIVNIVFASLLAVSRNIDAAVELILDGFPCCLYQQLFRHLVGVILGVLKGAGHAAFLVGAFAEVADRDIVGFGIGADTGSGNGHRAIIRDARERIKALFARAVLAKLRLMLNSLQQFIEQHERIFVLTGAGVSTASGIPDYRDRHGDWKHQRPMEYRDFIGLAEARQRYWARSFIGWQRFAAARPNAAHLALARLDVAGRVLLTVTQNVDGLHQRSGSSRVIELHGSLARVACLECNDSIERETMQARLQAQNPALAELSARLAPDGDVLLSGFDSSSVCVPACDACGGILKPGVVFFGETVPATRVRESFAALDEADAMLVVGSSLMVYSGFRFARKAYLRGIPVAAINLGKTRADAFLSLKIEVDCSEVLAALMNRIDGGRVGRKSAL